MSGLCPCALCRAKRKPKTPKPGRPPRRDMKRKYLYVTYRVFHGVYAPLAPSELVAGYLPLGWLLRKHRRQA